MRRALVHALVCSLILSALGGAAYQQRKALIRSWMKRNAAQVAIVGPRSEGQGAHVRPTFAAPASALVVLIDGLSRPHADRLREIDIFCQQGHRFVVDVGFPAVSFPVQHVLWSGLTQKQSGLLFVTRLGRTPFATLVSDLNARGQLTVAIAQAHREIAEAFRFKTLIAPPKGALADRDSRLGPAEMLAAASVEGDRIRRAGGVLFVHLLDVDRAGHRYGGRSPQYERAADAASRFVGRLVARLPLPTVLLSDHGHIAAGGHGGREDVVRLVRVCASKAIAVGSAPSTMVGVHRLLAAHLRLPVRRWQTRVRSPSRRSLATALLLLLCLLLWFGLWGPIFRGALPLWVPIAALPWAPLVALAALWLADGPPSLSHAYVYPALPFKLWPFGALAVVVVLAQLFVLSRALPRSASALLATLSALAFCIGPQLVAGPGVVTPRTSALASTSVGVFLWVAAAATVFALGAAVVAALEQRKTADAGEQLS